MNNHFRIFVCEVFYHVSKHLRDSLAPYSKKCVFLGYGKPSAMEFCIWDHESKKIPCSSDIYFKKEEMLTKPLKIVKICKVVFQEYG